MPGLYVCAHILCLVYVYDKRMNTCWLPTTDMNVSCPSWIRNSYEYFFLLIYCCVHFVGKCVAVVYLIPVYPSLLAPLYMASLFSL